MADIAEANPMVVFYHNTSETLIPRGLVMGDFQPPLTINVDNPEEDEGQRINFRTLVGAGPDENVDFLWEAFGRMTTWIYDGTYAEG
ncbi:uncharacterized protein PAC_02686 [Phialocephala subalpina]|uniref:Uncharacterized protein n=1 Tax=Phialocephala subalpina TaxID=576137 RepID=A0A1L7WJ47_9HELO|nr:uncharacterized protein PAC_02686 [Phialocephala subalpina]